MIFLHCKLQFLIGMIFHFPIWLSSTLAVVQCGSLRCLGRTEPKSWWNQFEKVRLAHL